MRLVARATAPDARRGNHVQRRNMMLRHVQTIDAGFVGGSNERQAFVENGCESAVRLLDVVE
jgi:hypothetical protein